MKFDFCIGNPPYQENDGGNGVSASPVYQLFVEAAKSIDVDTIVMITPSRWFSGGKGLDKFRAKALSEKNYKRIIDYVNAKECFPNNSISGGVNIFLWDKNYDGTCKYTSVVNGKDDTDERDLDEFDVLVRYNRAVSIIHKINYQLNSVVSILSSRNPFGIPTSARGEKNPFFNALKVISSKGEGYISSDEITVNKELVDKYKVLISRIAYEHAGEPDKDGAFRVLARVEVLNPGEVCTDSYIVGGGFDTKEEAENLITYLKCKFTRMLIALTLSSINLSKERFVFVPLQDWKRPWNDKDLYELYKLTEDEIDFIETIIKPM